MSNVESLPEPKRPGRAVAIATPLDAVTLAIKSGNVEIVAQGFALFKEMRAMDALIAFNNAMADAKSKIPVIVKNREVDFTSSKGRTNYAYEDLAGIAKVVDPILSEYGLSYRFRVGSKPGEAVSVSCILSHRDGHSEETTLHAGRDDSGNKNSIQAVGSAITYLQRYTLKAALGLAASVDDDAQAVTADEQRQAQPQSDFPGDRTEQSAFVTAAEAAHLRHLLKEKGAAESDFLKWAKRESVEKIPADKFDRCVKAINGYTGSTAQ